MGSLKCSLDVSFGQNFEKIPSWKKEQNQKTRNSEDYIFVDRIKERKVSMAIKIEGDKSVDTLLCIKASVPENVIRLQQ